MKVQRNAFLFILTFSVFLSNAFAGENSETSDGFTIDNSTDGGIAHLEIIEATVPLLFIFSDYARPEKLRLDQARKTLEWQRSFIGSGHDTWDEYVKAINAEKEAAEALARAENLNLRNWRQWKYRSLALGAEILIVGDMVSRFQRKDAPGRVSLNSPFGKAIYGAGEAGVENVREVLEDVGLVRHRPLEETHYNFDEETHYSFEEVK